LLLLILILVLSLGCEDESLPPRQYIDIDATLLELTLEDYGGFIIGDWSITNTSEHTIDGWEIRVNIIINQDQSENGIFFHHKAEITPGAVVEYHDNVLFHMDANSIYPIILESSNSYIAADGWDIISVKGVIL